MPSPINVTKSLKYTMRPENPKGYTTRQQIENYLLINIDASFWTQVDDWIKQVEEYIDGKTGRNFVATGPEERIFDGNGSTKLLIDDCVEIVKLEIGSTDKTEIAAGSYVTYPQNARKLSRPVPITRIQLIGTVFPCYPQIATVLGKWGYSIHPPKDIQEVATYLVAGIITDTYVPEGVVQSESIGRYSITYKTEGELSKLTRLKEDIDRTKEVLQRYRKYTF